MLSALEALAGLGNGDAGGGVTNGESGAVGSGDCVKNAAPIDPRSIRSTIEQSALQRALTFQHELRKLANAATELREHAERVEQCAEVLERRSCGGVVVMDLDDSTDGDAAPGVTNNANPASGSAGGDEDAWNKEQLLATRLYQAHRSYLNSTKRRLAVEAFLEKFDLTEDETRLLDSYEFEGSDEDSMAFLTALERLAVIRRELGKTFGKTEENEAEKDNEQRHIGTHSALRMVEQLAMRQERAYERLYQFIQTHLGIGLATTSKNASMASDATRGGRSMDPSYYQNNALLEQFKDGDDMDDAYSNLVLRRALYVLRNSRERHVHALEMIASSRRKEVTRRFLLALTSGYGGMAPLEMRAHDPVGYVGDMLAFAFRSFRVEGELIKTLFVWKEDDGNDSNCTDVKSSSDIVDKDEIMEENEEVNKPMDVLEVLSHSMGGLARPLGTRLQQVVKSLVSQGRIINEQTDSIDGNLIDNGSQGMIEVGISYEGDRLTSSLNQIVALFSICGLLKFYSSAVQNALNKLVHMKSDENIIRGDGAKNPFFDTCIESLTEASEAYVGSLRTYGATLSNHSSPDTTEASLAQHLIVCIAEERVASPGFADESCLPETSVSMKQLSLSYLVSTLVDAAIPYIRLLDDSAALKSAMNSAVKCGLEVSEAKKWIDLIQEKESELVEALVETEAKRVLSVCGLGSIQAAMEHMNAVFVDGMTMSSHPGLSQSDLESAMKQFYSSLFSPPIPTFEDTIKDPELRRSARSMTAKRVANEYRILYEAITSENGGYADLSFLGHDPEQVNTLLSL